MPLEFPEPDIDSIGAHHKSGDRAPGGICEHHFLQGLQDDPFGRAGSPVLVENRLRDALGLHDAGAALRALGVEVRRASELPGGRPDIFAGLLYGPVRPLLPHACGHRRLEDAAPAQHVAVGAGKLGESGLVRIESERRQVRILPEQGGNLGAVDIGPAPPQPLGMIRNGPALNRHASLRSSAFRPASRLSDRGNREPWPGDQIFTRIVA